MDGREERAATSRKFPHFISIAAIGALAVATACRGEPNPIFTDITEARAVAADLRVQFNKASDASNRSVMADTDEASESFAREAEQVKGLVRTDLAALGPRLRSLGYAAEIKSLEEF